MNIIFVKQPISVLYPKAFHIFKTKQIKRKAPEFRFAVINPMYI